MRKNPVLAKFRSGQPAVGTWATLVHHPKFMRLLATAGLDFAIIEMEHSDFTMADVSAQCLVARACGIAPIVRPPGLGHHDLTRPLDSGAMGLLLPCIDTPDQLEEALSITKYYPRGERILNMRGAHTDYERLDDPAEQIAQINAETLTVAMVETQTSLDALSEICVVDGLDAIMIGPDDLSQNLGVPGQMSHPLMKEARERVILVCEESGVPWGFSCPDIIGAQEWIDRGLRWLPFSNDANVLLDAFSSAAQTLTKYAKIRDNTNHEGEK
jgi:2-keto-3-deoxy-L-rhamnonate aldolase RhmA